MTIARKPSSPGKQASVDSQGNRDPTAGVSPGYAEQQPSNAAAASQPGGRRRPHNEEGGVGRNVAADPNADSDEGETRRRVPAASATRKRPR